MSSHDIIIIVLLLMGFILCGGLLWLIAILHEIHYQQQHFMSRVKCIVHKQSGSELLTQIVLKHPDGE